MYLIFDTETTGLPKISNAPHTDLDNWPRVVQIAWQLHDAQGHLLSAQNLIIRPEGFTIPFNSVKVHGISTERALAEGQPLADVLARFQQDVEKAEVLAGHNIIEFDLPLLGAEYLRTGMQAEALLAKKAYDTMRQTAEYVGIKRGNAGFKPPKLEELHQKLFGEGFAHAHDAAYDVSANAKCYFELLRIGVAPMAAAVAPETLRYEAPVLAEANFAKKQSSGDTIQAAQTAGEITQQPYAHLHAHSMYSILQSTANIKKLVKYAKEIGCTGLAITDFNNLFGAFAAVDAMKGVEDFKLVIGLEIYIAKDRRRTQFTRDERDVRYPQVLLAKNQKGYENLSRISSLGFIEGYYDSCARVDKDLIVKYKEGLIALSGSIHGIIGRLILNEGEAAGEKEFVWWLETFQDDFYVTLQRHGLEEEDYVNSLLLDWCRKYNVTYVAANESFYLKEKDWEAHDVLLCVKDGEKKSTPVGRGRGFRYGMPNHNFYVRTPEEMNRLFADLPEAVAATQEILAKCTTPKIQRGIMLPKFELPEPFETQDDFLRHLTYEGAKRHYGEITPEIAQRLDYELEVIKKMGFPGYFLIVQDFINAARRMGVSVGPGRGSAAGSAVAFCTGITNIDPIRYNLLFERFLNPERVSMPDIDVDFDDEGRGRVIEYVIQKYGKNQVAQIITYGAMKAKSAIKDAGRVLEFPLPETNELAKLVPEAADTTFEKSFEEVKELKEILEKDQTAKGDVLRLATKLEGCVRNTGIHAAGVIIAPNDLLDCVPVCTAKDAELLVTQFEGKYVEGAGMLKMDFLGLKTLSIIKDALLLIKKRHGLDIDIDYIPLDDPATFALYQRGDTVGTFQFESEGMRMYLRDLKPTTIEDLIAMNALYRPGPLQFIPDYINRKHGREPIAYPHPLLESILQPTNGIMIYQEQIMQAAQIMAGYTLGGADLLRRAMGKKDKKEMDRQRGIFVEGSKKLHDIPEDKATEVFDIMEKFASYGFNRSHSAAYSVVAYQTAYLKANYPAEYMASVLTHSMGTIEKISFFMEECRHIGVEVLGPDVNESEAQFSVNAKGQIRFGLGAIKGSGEAAVAAIVEEREKKGRFKDIYDFVERMNAKTINKKTLESLVYAGAFDSFGFHRAQYLEAPAGEMPGLERLTKYAAQAQADKNSAQVSLFGGSSGAASRPKMPVTEPWTDLVKLKYEKDVIGFYLSGHPLDTYRLILETDCVKTTELEQHKGKDIAIGGIISGLSIRSGQRGNFALFNVEDYEGSTGLAAFSDVYEKHQEILRDGAFVYIKGKMLERRDRPGQWDFRINSIQPLESVKGKSIPRLDLRIRVHTFQQNPQAISQLHELLQRYTAGGRCEVRFVLVLPNTAGQEQELMTLPSRSLRIVPNPNLLRDLTSHGIEYVI